MDAATLDELRTLRARAYGPSADIDQDPAALQRLHELEARSSAPDAPASEEADLVVSAEPAPIQARPGETPVPRGAEDVLVSDEASSTEKEAAPARTRKPRRISGRSVALWTLSVVGAAALAAGLTYSLTAVSPVDATTGVTQIDTLEPDPFVELPSGWFGAGPSSVAFEYYGLTLFESAGGYSGYGTDCFSVVGSEQLPEPGADTNSWTMSGVIYSGCRAGAFPATVQFVVDSNAPQQLRDRFPADSALQFIFDGSRIGVFLAPGDS
ncbi:hypothetical protein ACFC1I_05840 [Microbacterium sp. NPDC056044]|uniref:hypothetical protein n=1 Tax=Microbacterium sp. NPDC056044 TaxID=3345690 RepID=UPI0035D6C704